MIWLDIIARIERGIIVTCSVLLASAICLVVVMRYVFHIDLFAYEEPVLLVAFVLYFMGAAHASYTDEHIKADLISNWIQSPRRRQIYQAMLHGISAAICLALAVYGVKMLLNELATYPAIPRTTVYQIPFAVSRAFIPIGFMLMAAHSICHALRTITQLRHVPEALEPSTSSEKGTS